MFPSLPTSKLLLPLQLQLLLSLSQVATPHLTLRSLMPPCLMPQLSLCQSCPLSLQLQPFRLSMPSKHWTLQFCRH